MKSPSFTTYKAQVTKGYLGDFATEWWTDEDHAKWAEHVQELKDSGEFGKKEEVEMTLVHNPELDDRKLSSAIESAKMEFLDFGSAQFHGIAYTLQDGTIEFASVHPEIKEQIELLINGK